MDGITSDELGTLITDSKERAVPVETVVTEALRAHAERLRRRKERAANHDGSRPSLLNGLPKVPV